MSSQRTNEFLNLWSANGFVTIPTLRLNINQAEAKFVFTDDTINAFITGLPDDRAGIIHRATISHLRQQLDDQMFKESGRLLHYFTQEIICQGSVDLLKGFIQNILWCFTGYFCCGCRSGAFFIIVRRNKLSK